MTKELEGSGKSAGKKGLAAVLFLLCSVPLTVRALVRVWYWTRRDSLDSVAIALRSVRPFEYSFLLNPQAWLVVVNRLLPLLKPLGFGPCLLRSLLLLDLWGRCGAQPRLHLGFEEVAESRGAGHAWLTSSLDPELSTASCGFRDQFGI